MELALGNATGESFAAGDRQATVPGSYRPESSRGLSQPVTGITIRGTVP